MIDLRSIPNDAPVLIYGPTASGKSALALQIAEAGGGVIVNADALQVFDGWRVLTARPGVDDEARAPHALYGHVPFDAPYSVGHWLRDVTPLVQGGARPIIVGGTGLNFAALTQGLADIPATPPPVRDLANTVGLDDMLAALDPVTLGRIDQNNRARVQRAWEVQQATGRSIADWQDKTPPPLLPLSQVTALAMMPDPDWLNDRIARRFDLMIRDGALDEAAAMEPRWNPDHPSAKAIGAAELIAHIRGEIPLERACELAVIASRRYAKRQRTWLRSRMQDWQQISLPAQM
ncbi:tRNA (adenosine(37)-N6)-dimethylallyltransferase MiaA [Octadecabacter sp. R77987]|uniref:tRNA (adenosine(37)-N6)-dimethylallyltransferase MiaA n=1 Tax=Octadecabacter sp. R77987 TaxID=3093874 RepID=UPI00366BAFBB